MAGWRVARALLTLRGQADQAWPKRDTASDGTIGDAAHATRDSDHNPWVTDPAGVGVVTAIDLTHDPAHGADMHTLAAALAGSRDRRIKYLIWNRAILRSYPKTSTPAWTWTAYSGPNPHTAHLHLSVHPDQAHYDSTTRWRIPEEDQVQLDDKISLDPWQRPYYSKPGEPETTHLTVREALLDAAVQSRRNGRWIKDLLDDLTGELPAQVAAAVLAAAPAGAPIDPAAIQAAVGATVEARLRTVLGSLDSTAPPA
ncbi:MAG: hypothetical protein L0Y54_10015 [Sporichthyaceae bacterium]|nr:hypothetical protein [Sporichthyaceae bacterium]